MRTTVTLDADVERLLRDDMHRHRRTFKESLNLGLRAGLGQGTPTRKLKPFKVTPWPMGLPEDPRELNHLAWEMEDALLRERRRATAAAEVQRRAERGNSK